MPSTRRLELREEARLMFRHGWENYWDIAFPEDEVDKTVELYPEPPRSNESYEHR